MTIDIDDNWPAGSLTTDLLPQICLEIVGSFSFLQSYIDYAMERLLSARVPEVGPWVYKRYLKDRTSDRDRIRAVHALDREVNYSGDLSHFTDVYRQCKQLRDRIGHSGGPPMIVYDPASKERVVAIPTFAKSAKDHLPKPLLPDHVIGIRHDCKWLGDHVLRLLYESELAKFMRLDGETPLEPPLPPSKPPHSLLPLSS